MRETTTHQTNPSNQAIPQSGTEISGCLTPTPSSEQVTARWWGAASGSPNSSLSTMPARKSPSPGADVPEIRAALSREGRGGGGAALESFGNWLSLGFPPVLSEHGAPAQPYPMPLQEREIVNKT